MRIPAIALAVLVSCGPAAWAAEPLRIYAVPLREEPSPYAHLNLSQAQLLAAQQLEAAQYRFVTWMQFEYPQQVRAIELEITMLQEQIGSAQRRSAEYNHFNVWSRGGNPFFADSEDLHLTNIGLEQRLSMVQSQRAQLLQQQPIEYRLRQMEVERARLNLRLAK